MKHHLRYLKYVICHKWFVLVAGLRTDVPFWRLIIHDWSKFSKAEWTPYVDSFYRYKDNRTPAIKLAFDQAWLHHQHRNPHHWQHWILRKDNGEIVVLEMPDNYLREMVADWMGAGRAITGKWDIEDWYTKNRNNINIGAFTRGKVEELIEAVSEQL